MRFDIMWLVVVGLWFGVAACNKDEGDGGGGLQTVCEKLAACGGSPAQECVDQFGSCAAAEAKASECAGMSGCDAVGSCFLPVIFECLPEGTSSGSTFGTTDDTVTPTSDATTTTEDTSTTTAADTETGSSGEASSGSSGDTGTDTGDDVGLYRPCAQVDPECPENYVCVETSAGKFCSIKCDGGMCPANPVEDGPEALCTLMSPDRDEPDFCAIICDPTLPNSQCPNDLFCQMVPFNDFGVCSRP